MKFGAYFVKSALKFELNFTYLTLFFDHFLDALFSSNLDRGFYLRFLDEFIIILTVI